MRVLAKGKRGQCPCANYDQKQKRPAETEDICPGSRFRDAALARKSRGDRLVADVFWPVWLSAGPWLLDDSAWVAHPVVRICPGSAFAPAIRRVVGKAKAAVCVIRVLFAALPGVECFIQAWDEQGARNSCRSAGKSNAPAGPS